MGQVGFTLANAAKDYSYYTHMLEHAGVPAFIAEAVHQSYVQANALGLGDRYIASMLEMQEQINDAAAGSMPRNSTCRRTPAKSSARWRESSPAASSHA